MDFGRGVADLACPLIVEARAPRLSARDSLHINELVLAVNNAFTHGRTYDMTTDFLAPEPMPWATEPLPCRRRRLLAFDEAGQATRFGLKSRRSARQTPALKASRRRWRSAEWPTRADGVHDRQRLDRVLHRHRWALEETGTQATRHLSRLVAVPMTNKGEDAPAF